VWVDWVPIAKRPGILTTLFECVLFECVLFECVLCSRGARQEFTMSFTLFSGERCPRCHKPNMQSDVEPHPSRPDLALQNFKCADCGPVKTIVLSLKQPVPHSEQAV
jgi:hypothetical protein